MVTPLNGSESAVSSGQISPPKSGTSLSSVSEGSGHITNDAPIAVVGMGWRGPGDATHVADFYKLLAEAREARVANHKGKWNHNAFYHPDSARKGAVCNLLNSKSWSGLTTKHSSKSNIEAGHYFSGDISLFDAPFFSMTEAEAAVSRKAQENSSTYIAS